MENIYIVIPDYCNGISGIPYMQVFTVNDSNAELLIFDNITTEPFSQYSELE